MDAKCSGARSAPCCSMPRRHGTLQSCCTPSPRPPQGTARQWSDLGSPRCLPLPPGSNLRKCARTARLPPPETPSSALRGWVESVPVVCIKPRSAFILTDCMKIKKHSLEYARIRNRKSHFPWILWARQSSITNHMFECVSGLWRDLNPTRR